MSTENTASGNQSFEAKLLDILKHEGFEQEHLNQLVKVVANLQGGGLVNTRVHAKGIPRPTALQVEMIAEPTQLNTILNSIVSSTIRIDTIQIFPYGILNPEIFQVLVEVAGF